MTPRLQAIIASLADANLVSVTMEYRSGPGAHDFRYVYTNMSGAALQHFNPQAGMCIVGVCSLDDEWD